VPADYGMEGTADGCPLTYTGGDAIMATNAPCPTMTPAAIIFLWLVICTSHIPISQRRNYPGELRCSFNTHELSDALRAREDT